MKRLTYIEIVGKIYPMSFSLMATKKIAQKYGSVKDFLKNINTEGSEEKTISVISEVLELLISQGCAYKNYFEKDVPAPDNAPIIETDKYFRERIFAGSTDAVSKGCHSFGFKFSAKIGNLYGICTASGEF